MKKTILSALMVSVLPLSAMADVTVYGKANVSLQNADESGDAKIELVSNASRIGLKGSEEITEGLKAIYQLEYQTEVDDGSGSNSQTFNQRNIYIGLQGSAGTIMGGHFDTPLKVVQEKVDLFNDLEGDLATIFNGETRASNTVQYVTPASFGPFAAAVAYIAKEASEEEDVDDGVSASVGFTNDFMYLGLAMDQDVQMMGVDIARAVARVNVGPIQLGALYEMSDNSNTDVDGAGVLVSVLGKITDNFALKAQYGESDVKMYVEEDTETLSVGADYKLSANTTLFGYYTAVENESTRDDDYIGVGMDIKF